MLFSISQKTSLAVTNSFNPFIWESLLHFLVLDSVPAEPGRGNTVSIFIFPWERAIKENAQIPKESHSRWFLISETDIKEPSGTGSSSLH